MDIIIYTLQAVSAAIIEPLNLLMLISIGIVFYFKNHKISIIQKITVGESLNSPLELTLSQIVLGIIAGAIASILLALIGVSFSETSGIEIILMISILSLFYRDKILKIPYISFILGLIAIIFPIIKEYLGLQRYINMDIRFLIIFVAIINLVEGILISIDGDRGAIPIFTNKNDKIIGGFSLNRSWPIPIAVLIIMTGSTVGMNTINTLLGILVSIPFYGLIGYNVITFTKKKKVKALESGIIRVVYGISLIGISYIASFNIIGQILTLLYMILVYEGITIYERRCEFKGDSIYVSDDEGITVLEVAPNSSAFEVGIRRGDKVIAINGKEVESEADILKAVRDGFFKMTIKVKKQKGNIVEYLIHPKNKKLGMLLVPKFIDKENTIKINSNEIKKRLNELKKKE